MPLRPTTSQDAAIRSLALENGATPPPARPVPGECCDRGCSLCVWDYYERGLRRWGKRHGLTEQLERLLEA